MSGETDPTITPNKEYQEYLTDIKAPELDRKGEVIKRSNIDTASFFPNADAIAVQNLFRFMGNELDCEPYRQIADIISTDLRSFEGIGRTHAVLAQYKQPDLLAQNIIGSSGQRLKLAKDED
jgi:hypothetical protein